MSSLNQYIERSWLFDQGTLEEKPVANLSITWARSENDLWGMCKSFNHSSAKALKAARSQKHLT